MSTKNESKITKLLRRHKPNTACLAPWLDALGISRELQKRYRHNGWLESVGTGAFKLPSDDVGWKGGLYSLQTQAELPVHAGAMTALTMQGLAHYTRVGKETVFLFSPPKTLLPAWFRKHDWGSPIRHVRTSAVPEGLGLRDHEDKTFKIRISAPERAMLESLYLAPNEADLVECFQVMEGLTNLRPDLVQKLLIGCTSVKVKRLFLYLAEKADHQWYAQVDASKFDLGKGHRRIVKGGVYTSKYCLTVPHELAAL